MAMAALSCSRIHLERSPGCVLADVNLSTANRPELACPAHVLMRVRSASRLGGQIIIACEVARNIVPGPGLPCYTPHEATRYCVHARHAGMVHSGARDGALQEACPFTSNGATMLCQVAPNDAVLKTPLPPQWHCRLVALSALGPPTATHGEAVPSHTSWLTARSPAKEAISEQTRAARRPEPSPWSRRCRAQ